MDRFGLAHRISRKQDRLLDRLRDRRTDAAAGVPGTADGFAALIGEELALLVTFRRVRVGPCTVRGRPKGSFADGVARILGAAEENNAELALDLHYGLRRRLYVRFGAKLGVRSVYLELTPTRIDRA